MSGGPNVPQRAAPRAGRWTVPNLLRSHEHRSRGILIATHLALGLGMAICAHDRTLWPWMVSLGLLAGAFLWLSFKHGAPHAVTVLLIAVLLRVFWLGLPPRLSDDSWRYAWDAQLVADGINPYRYAPSDPALAGRSPDLFKELNSSDFYSVYPPVSQWVFAAANRLSGQEFMGFYFTYKVILVLLELLALILLARMVPAGFLMLFAWNPVTVIAGAGQGHTDVLLALPLVGLVWACQRRRDALLGGLLAAATLVKLWPGLVAPLLLRRPVALASLVAVAAVLSAPFVAPYVPSHVGQSLDLYVRYFEFNAGPYLALKRVFMVFTGEDWSKQLGPALRLLFLVLTGVLLLRAWLRRWRLEDALFGLGALMLILATTVHPWYVYPLLLLATLRTQSEWAWQWLSVVSIGTYLLYVDGPYWAFVVMGWTGFVGIGSSTYGRKLLDAVMRDRARWKAAWLGPWVTAGRGWTPAAHGWTPAAHGAEPTPWLENEAILDIGGAEGFVADELHRLTGRPVVVADLSDSRRVDVPLVRVDGRTLPFADGTFGAVTLSFVLHHAEDPQALLTEAQRVALGPIVVLESTFQTRSELARLTFLDRWANRIRSMGSSMTSEEFVHFRTRDEWLALFQTVGLSVLHEEPRVNPLHRKHLFVLGRQGGPDQISAGAGQG